MNTSLNLLLKRKNQQLIADELAFKAIEEKIEEVFLRKEKHVTYEHIGFAVSIPFSPKGKSAREAMNTLLHV